MNEGVLKKIPILSLHSNQEEADTRIILHVLHIAGTEKEIDVNTIIVRSPDTDVLLLLIHFSLDIQTHSIYFDTGTGNKRRLISIKAVVEKIGVQFSKALLGFHAFTGCDTTSAFMRKGKVRPFKLLQKRETFIDTFIRLGESDVLSNDVIDSLESFVCAMYGKGRSCQVNDVRYDLAILRFKASKAILSGDDGTDFCFIPPCKDSLVCHIKRCNYQTFIWKRANVQFIEYPSLFESGWKRNDGNLALSWNESDIVPPNLLDITDDDDVTIPTDESDDCCDELFIDAELISEDEDDDEDFN